MTDKAKARRKAIAAENGVSRRTAANIIRGRARSTDEPTTADSIRIVPNFDPVDPAFQARPILGGYKEPLRPIEVLNGDRRVLVWAASLPERSRWRWEIMYRSGPWPLLEQERRLLEEWLASAASASGQRYVWPAVYLAPRELRGPMRRDVIVRRLGNVEDAHYVVVRYDPYQGQTFQDAVHVLQEDAAAWDDLLQAAVRRADQPAHPWVCWWTRDTASDPWTFSWLEGADDPSALPPTFTTWGRFLDALQPTEVALLRHLFDHEHGPLHATWADIWSTVLLQEANRCGLTLSSRRAQRLLADLCVFGVIGRNAHSTSLSEPSFAITSFFLESAKRLGSWFELGAEAPDGERLAVLEALQVTRADLAWFREAALGLSNGARVGVQARIMGRMIGALGRHPAYKDLFEQLRAEHNAGCPVEARVRVLRAPI